MTKLLIDKKVGHDIAKFVILIPNFNYQFILSPSKPVLNIIGKHRKTALG